MLVFPSSTIKMKGGVIPLGSSDLPDDSKPNIFLNTRGL